MDIRAFLDKKPDKNSIKETIKTKGSSSSSEGGTVTARVKSIETELKGLQDQINLLGNDISRV